MYFPNRPRWISGIYVVSALGGPARKIVPEGRRPRFSPDGSQIAYWSGTIGGGAAFSTRNYCRIFVVASAGGVPRQVRPDFVGAAYPEWALARGDSLIFSARSDDSSNRWRIGISSKTWKVTGLLSG